MRQGIFEKIYKRLLQEAQKPWGNVAFGSSGRKDKSIEFEQDTYERLLREMYEDDEEDMSAESMFYSILRNMADANGGWLKLTHESPRKNRVGILKSGILDLDHGIYAFVGWNSQPRWMTPGAGDVWHFKVPVRHINSQTIVPDDRFGTGGYEDFLAEFPDVVGGEVSINLDRIPSNWIATKEFEEDAK
jgi:hypothetical protein